MSEELMYRRHISRQQLELLAQYMERYPPLALASARSREGHEQSKRMWEKIARTLNRIDGSVTKSGRDWAKYWTDFKFKIRRKYAVILKCRAEGTPCSVALSPLELRIVKILTDKEGNLLPVASVCSQIKGFRFKDGKTRLKKEKSLSDNDTKNEDSDSTDEQSQDDYLVAKSPITVNIPDCSDIKPNINGGKHDKDPIIIPQVVINERKNSIEGLKKQLFEFELEKQKELFKMEKQFKKEKHQLEMSILRIKKRIMMKDLRNYNQKCSIGNICNQNDGLKTVHD